MKISAKLILLSVAFMLCACALANHSVTMVGGDDNGGAAISNNNSNSGKVDKPASTSNAANPTPANTNANTAASANTAANGTNATATNAEPRAIAGTDDFLGSSKVGVAYMINGVKYYPLYDSQGGYHETGIGSWYGYEFNNEETSNGEIADMYSFSASHKTLPMPTYVLVENLENGKEAVVRVNDRGPFIKKRIIDVSYAAANELDFLQKGTTMVRITVLSESPDRLVTEGKDVDLNKGQFSVQIGAFANRINADTLAAQYETGTVIVPWKSHYNEQVFRVRVRGYQSRAEAEVALKELVKRYPEAFVVAE